MHHAMACRAADLEHEEQAEPVRAAAPRDATYYYSHCATYNVQTCNAHWTTCNAHWTTCNPLWAACNASCATKVHTAVPRSAAVGYPRPSIRRDAARTRAIAAAGPVPWAAPSVQECSVCRTHAAARCAPCTAGGNGHRCMRLYVACCIAACCCTSYVASLHRSRHSVAPYFTAAASQALAPCTAAVLAASRVLCRRCSAQGGLAGEAAAAAAGNRPVRRAAGKAYA